MTTSLVAIAQPPWEMTTPATAQTVITAILAVVVAGFVVAALLVWRRSGKPDFLLMLAGGLICSFNEETVDVLGHCFFPNDGWTVHAFFGRGIPVWVVLGYVIFFGGLPYLMAFAFQHGVTHRIMWTCIGIFWVLNVALEIPVLGTRLYVYYGYQPFEIGGFPISWLVINSLGAVFGAVVLTRLAWLFAGAPAVGAVRPVRNVHVVLGARDAALRDHQYRCPDRHPDGGGRHQHGARPDRDRCADPFRNGAGALAATAIRRCHHA